MIWRKLRWRGVVIGCVLLLVGFLGGGWFVAGALISPANHEIAAPPTDLPIEAWTIPSKSGATIGAWYVPAEDTRATVVLIHPIRGDRTLMVPRAKMLHELGFATVLVDLQAHGESIGRQITAGYLERHDVLAVIDHLRARDPNQRIGVIGCSLGGAAALLASSAPIDALVLESVYPTISEAVHDRVALRLGPLHHVVAPVLLLQLRVRLGIAPAQLRPIDHLANLHCPVLIAAGDLDRHTPLRETQRMFDAAHEPKKLAIFHGAEHADLLNFNAAQYRSDVVSFLDTHLRKADND